VGLGFPPLFKRSKHAQTAQAGTIPTSAPLPSKPLRAASEGATRLPRFKATATDQVDRRRTDRFLSLRMRLRSAFTPAQPILDGAMFAGRQKLLANAISAIEDRRLHVVLHGERGIGKTSLLHVLAEAARAARYVVVYSSCGSGANFQDTFLAAAGEIPLLFHDNYGPTSEEAEAGASMADLLPENFSPRQFADLCGKLAGTRALIFLDEFDRAESPTFRRDVAELIKFLSDRSVRLQLVIGGVASDLSELVHHIPSIRRNILAVRVPQMNEEEVRELIGNGERASGLTFDPAARDLIVRIAYGWPYIAVLVCHNAGLCALDAQRDAVQEDDVLAALDTCAAELRARMSRATIDQVDGMFREDGGRTLLALAAAALQTGGEFGPADVEAASQQSVESATAKRILEQLAAKRILLERRGEPGAGQYGFIDEGLPPYLWFLGARDDLVAAPVKARANAR
jgi:hypothetical protein